MELRERREERVAQERRWAEEMELRRAEYERLQRIDAEKAEQESFLAARTITFADSVKHVFIKMSDDPAEFPMFLLVLRIYTRCMKFHAFLHAKLLLPLLTEKARLVTNRLSLSLMTL